MQSRGVTVSVQLLLAGFHFQGASPTTWLPTMHYLAIIFDLTLLTLFAALYVFLNAVLVAFLLRRLSGPGKSRA